MGRKKLPETERRTHWLKIRLNQKEYEMLQKLSEWYEEPKSYCIRALIYNDYEEMESYVKSHIDFYREQYSNSNKEFLEKIVEEANSMQFDDPVDRYFYIYEQAGVGFTEEEKKELRETIERRK